MALATYSPSKRVALRGLFFVAALGFPFAAQAANPLDFIGNWLAKSVFAAEVSVPDRAEPQNTQNMALLQAAVNIDPTPVKDGGNVTVVNDSALSSGVGPAGTIVDIKTTEQQGSISLYVVHKGDTLASVAKMFGVSTTTILSSNNLEKGAALHEGQSLVILPVDGIQHVVKKGDTVKSLAKKYKSNADEIAAFNDLGADYTLTVGETIIIPEGVIEATTTTTKAKTPASSGAVRSSLPSYAGYYKNPLPTGIKSQGLHYGLHGNGKNSVDVAARTGVQIYAAADGVVSVSNFKTLSNPWFSGFGNYVIVDHPNGTKTLYAHMSTVYVAEGAHVDQGQPIGEVGSTGRSTGPHLHFEVIGAKNPF